MSNTLPPKTNRQLALTVAKFAEATNLSLVSIDSRGDIEFVNPSACKLFGYTRSEMIGQPIMIIIPERMRGAHMAGLQRVAGGQAPHLGGRPVEVCALKKDGTEFPIEITLSVWNGKRGFCAGAVITDISDRRERESKLLRLARQDTLTGLSNRHRFSTLLAESLAAGNAASIILLDLDGFKEVNDTHGHLVGDSLLQAIGVRLPYMLGRNAEIARIGGDEFAVLLPGINNPLAAHAQAQAILEAFRKPFDVGGQVLELGTSIGIALAPAHGQDNEELIASADFALYRAKAEGGNVIRLYDASMRSETAARREMRDELLRALRGGELELFYQPQVDLLDKRIVGLEALLRWHHPQRGLLTPGAFLPALDQSALALEIGWWTLDQAAARAGALQANGYDIKVGVNLFPGQLRAPNLIHKVANALQRHSLKPDRLELEVTETITLANDDQSFEAMTALRDLGVGIAFDDFGTGYASLGSLQRYPLTTLKIDRGFVQHINDNPSDIAITRALVGLSREMGLKTIAEGIETEEQERTLIGLGCPFGQGYRYGKPVPFLSVVELLLHPGPMQASCPIANKPHRNGA
ncbi:EAL domain-containing protein [Rhizobium sophorae]|uniref:EAL domain-containing protein n=1 Tax=Rhizobium sophorae TaxID=1535242 RepID=A0A7Y3S195_9HYPH|nr:EAL domain-containing protein [Rhizobium sophorae]MBX4862788.1 EAL domain-containing protein [Rhizobium bangladeshense]NKL38049.1 EAL domain-containing protein [Rhizobium leguminosarum bv. viciae]NNU35184.1 EAL domain-containing protein [Rhizobium sophorae]